MYIITVRRITSGELLKYRKGFRIARHYGQPLRVSREFALTLPDAGIRPLPVQQPLPLWFGGHADAVLMRVAKWGAGWLPSTPLAADTDGRAAIARLRELIRGQGRDPDEIEMTRVYPAGEGRIDTWRRDIAALRDIGVTEISLETQRAGYDTVDDHLRAFRQFSELAQEFASGMTDRS